MTDPRKALHELREYFEQKRDLALRENRAAAEVELNSPTDFVTQGQADAYNHAMEMVAAYLDNLSKPQKGT